MIAQWVRYGLIFLSMIVLSRLLTPADYGLMTMTMAIVGAATVIGDFGLSLSAIRSKELSQADKSSLFYANILIGVIVAALMLLLSPVFGSFYQEPTVSVIAAVMSSLFAVNGFAVQSRVELVRSRRFGRIASIEVAAQIVAFAAAVVAAANGAGVWALVIQSLLSGAVIAVATVVAARWLPSRPAPLSALRSHLSFGADTFALQILNYISTNVDSVSIGRSLGASALGLYNRAFQLIMLPTQQLLTPLTRVVVPRLSTEVHTGLRANYVATAIELQRLLTLPLILVIGGLASLSEPLLGVILGTQWTKASTVLEILALGAAFQASAYIYYWCSLATADTRALMLAELPGRVAMIGLITCVAAAGFRIEWVAAGMVAGQILLWASSTFWLRRKLELPRQLATIPLWAMIPATVGYLSSHAARLLTASMSDWMELSVCGGVWLVVSVVVTLTLPPLRQTLRDGASRIRRIRGGT